MIQNFYTYKQNKQKKKAVILILHRCTEFEGTEWKEVFPLSINDKRLTGELQPTRDETAFIRNR